MSHGIAVGGHVERGDKSPMRNANLLARPLDISVANLGVNVPRLSFGWCAGHVYSPSERRGRQIPVAKAALDSSRYARKPVLFSSLRDKGE
jgi:hypothetical protein